MELQGTVHTVGAIQTKRADFKVAEIVLDRKSIRLSQKTRKSQWNA